MKKKLNKKAISPVIATVLLIAMVVVIALIIFLWFKGMTKEAIVKFGKNVELNCKDVSFDASYSSGTLSISNVGGNVPLFSMKIKEISEGSYETKDLRDLSKNWPDVGLNPGKVFSEQITFSGVKKIIVIPVLLGNTESNIQKTFVCDEQYGKEIDL